MRVAAKRPSCCSRPGAGRRAARCGGGGGAAPSPLLPDLGPAVAKVSRQSLTSSYLDHPVLPELEARLIDGWPFPAEALTVVDGAMDALDRVAPGVGRLGGRGGVEHPALPPL